MNRLENKTALITGAARGIGEAIARAFVAEGATVWATDIDEAAGRSSAATVGARFLPLDVRDEARWAEVINQIGGLDILVNNAGISGFQDGGPHDPEHCSLAAWRAVHETNVDGTFLGCKYAIGAMRRGGGGSIINLSSRSGQIGVPGAAAYASSKAAIRNHSKSVALYCAQQGLAIRCNSVHPALIDTPIWDDMLGGPGPDHDRRFAALAAAAPLKRAGTAAEVAAMVVYLASDEAAYVTGSEFNIDGGLLAGAPASPK